MMRISAEHPRFDRFRAVQQLTTVVEREYHYARKYYEVDRPRGLRHLFLASRAEELKLQLQNSLYKPYSSKAVLLDMDDCDRELSKVAFDIQEASRLVKEIEEKRTLVRSIIGLHSAHARDFFCRNRSKAEEHFGLIGNLERELFDLADKRQQIERQLRRRTELLSLRSIYWSEQFLPGYSQDVRNLVLMASVRTFGRRESPIHSLPIELLVKLRQVLLGYISSRIL